MLLKEYCAAKCECVKIYSIGPANQFRYSGFSVGPARISTVLDLFTHLLQIQTSPAAPFWLRLIVALVLIMPVALTVSGLLASWSLYRHRSCKRQFARRMGWKWESGGAFSGTLANNAGWEGGAYADERSGTYLNWSGGPLACRTEHKLYVVSRVEYDRQRSARLAEKQALEDIAVAAGVPFMSVTGLRSLASRLTVNPDTVGTDTVDAQTVDAQTVASMTVYAIAYAPTLARSKSEAPWMADSSVQACPIDNRAFEERFVLLTNNQVFARAAFSDAAVRQLLDWDAVRPEQFKVRLAWNRLVLELRPGSADHLDIEKFGKLALTVAENANASNGAGYWSQRRSAG